VFLEAMAAGLPLVVSNVGGHLDFLDEGKNALLIDPGDAGALATAVKGLLEDSDMRERMTQANRQVSARFTVAEVTKKFETILIEAQSL